MLGGKANFDGPAKGNPSLARCGGIIRNNHGIGIAALSYPIENQTNHFAKASATYHTTKLALKEGINNLWLEGDSLNIINCLKGVVSPSWKIQNLIEETRIDLGKFKKVHIGHVYREANPTANWFSNKVVRRNMTMCWNHHDLFPTAVNEILLLQRIQGSTCNISS